VKNIPALLLSVILFSLFAASSISVQYQSDGYNITNEMIKNAYTINRQSSVRNDIIYFLPTAVFKNNEKQQAILNDCSEGHEKC
jgi:hypothetical protein